MITTKWHGRGKWAYPMNTFIPLTGYSRFKKKKERNTRKEDKKEKKRDREIWKVGC